MYRLTGFIKNVGHSYIVNGNKVIFINLTGDLKYVNIQNIESEFLIEEGIVTFLEKFKNGLIYTKNKNSFISIADKLQKFDSVAINVYDELVMFNAISQEKEKFILLYKNEVLKWALNFKNGSKRLLTEKYFLTTSYLNNLELNAIDNENGDLIWSFDFLQFPTWLDYDGSEKPTELQKLLGVYEDGLYISLTSGKILVLDVITGKQVALLINDKNKDQGYFNGHFSKVLELDEKSGMLIQLFNDRFTTINLKTYEVIERTVQEMSDQKLYNKDNFVFDDEYIYFTEKYNKKIGAFNRSTLKLDWLTSLHQENLMNIQDEPYGRQLKLHDNRLYVLDSHNTLHIFEKDIRKNGLIS